MQAICLLEFVCVRDSFASFQQRMNKDINKKEIHVNDMHCINFWFVIANQMQIFIPESYEMR